MKSNGTSSWEETPAGKQLIRHLSEEKTLMALDRLVQKVEDLEQAISGLQAAMNQGPGMVSMLADSVDETVREASHKGIDFDERLRNALHLGERLTDPVMVEKIESLISLAEEAPGLVSMAIDSLDETVKHAAAQGVDFNERLKALGSVGEKMTRPPVLEQLGGLADLAVQAPGLASLLIDSIDESMREAKENGLDMVSLGSNSLKAIDQLAKLIASDEFAGMLQSGVLSAATLKLLSEASEALEETQSRPVKKIGLFGTISALGDSDRKKALGFLMSFLKSFGKRL